MSSSAHNRQQGAISRGIERKQEQLITEWLGNKKFLIKSPVALDKPHMDAVKCILNTQGYPALGTQTQAQLTQYLKLANTGKLKRNQFTEIFQYCNAIKKQHIKTKRAQQKQTNIG